MSFKRVAIGLVILTIFVPSPNLFGQEENEAAAVELIIEALINNAQDETLEVRVAAMQALASFQSSDEEFLDCIRKALRDARPEIREAAFAVLRGQSADNETVNQLLLDMATSDDLELVAAAIDEFTPARQSRYIDQIIELVESKNTTNSTRLNLLGIFYKNEKELDRILPALEQLYPESDSEFKQRMLELFSYHGAAARAVLPFLAEQLNEPSAQKLALIECVQKIMIDQKSRSERRAAYVDRYLIRYDADRTVFWTPMNW